MIVIKIMFFVFCFIIFWAMIGYPVSLKVLKRLLKVIPLPKDFSYKPTVTLMIVAHNEEKVIYEKLNNAIELDYPIEKLEILVSSDNSTDKTNDIVKKFINEHQNMNIRLYEVKERKGKTNAQNEAAKTVESEILVMTDANSILDKNSINEITAAFYSDDISYVKGRLVYINPNESITSNLENSYWDLDTSIREIESNIQTITGGNGALYACRTKEYYNFDPIKTHDSAMPLYYALNGKRAIANHKAIAYEKAGETLEDEFARKVRINRTILKVIVPNIRVFNVFKYKWFSYFYFGHRTCRYLLWISHIIILVTNLILWPQGLIYKAMLIFQILFYLLALLKKFFNINNKVTNMVYYYCMTIMAQIIGGYRIITGKAKPFWEKAESTR